MRSFGWNILLMSFASLASAAEVLKRCPAPPKYQNTRLADKFANKNTFNVGDKVAYTCAQDFTPSPGTGGSTVVECVAKGTWTKLSLKCEKKSCGNAGELPNGEFQYGESTFIGDKVYAVCSHGFTLRGLNYMICTNAGWTGDFPICEEAGPTCSAPAVAHSVQSGGSGAVYHVGQKVKVTCNLGFRLDGTQQLTCGPGGQWQPKLPRCLLSPVNNQPPPGKNQPAPGRNQPPAAKRGGYLFINQIGHFSGRELSMSSAGRCGVPLSVGKANLADKYLTMTSFASGERVHYVCDIGYAQSGGSRFRTCKDGEWTKLVLRCERKSCGSAGDILNGQYIYSGVEFGDIATAVCDEGYVLVGKETRRCMDKGWEGRNPVCEAVECPEPHEVDDAVRSGLQEPPYTYSSVLIYTCTKGTLVGPREIWCTKFGTWSSQPPKCKDIRCQAPNMANAFWVGAHDKHYDFGDTLSIECQPGYVMIGTSTVTCGADGRWVPNLPKCSQKQWRLYRHGS